MANVFFSVQDIIINGNFENGADGWQLFKVGEEYATLTASEERGNVLRLADDEHRDPWAMQFVKNLSSGAVYRVTADLKAVSLKGSARFKTEFYSDNIHSADTGVSQADMPAFDVQANGEWQSVYFDVKVPFGANCLCLYARLYGAGEIYYDNIKMHMIKQAPILCVTSDAFVYTEWESAFVKASFYDPSYHIAENSSIVFSLLDEERLLDTKRTPAKNENHYVFPTSLLAEKQKKYIVRVEYISSDGKVIDSFDEPLYRYDRPSRLTKDGRFINENGEKILIGFGYHASNSHFEDCAEIGINAIQLNAAANTLEYTAKQLDKLHKIGIYAFLELYGGMKPSAHPRNIQHTVEVVRAFKDHSAVMGYMIMDEPFLNDPNCYEVLRDSYKLFRDMDPDKPVYIVECERRWLYKTVTVCDILAIDPYPTGAKPYRTHVSDFSRTADIVNTHGKPVMNILQAYKLGGWEPDAQAMRHMAYQAFFAGNSSVGYYPVSDEGGLLYGNAKSNPDFLYQGVKYFMQHEYSDAHKAFVTKEYPAFSHLSSDLHNVWFKLYIKDGKLHLIAINRCDNTQRLSIPLASGGIAVKDFKAIADDMLRCDTVTGSGTLCIELEPLDVVRYIIEPDEPIDISLLEKSAFGDTDDAAINRLLSLGFCDTVTDKFRPDDIITEEEFVFMAQRALNIDSESKSEISSAHICSMISSLIPDSVPSGLETMTRKQAAQLLTSVIDNVKEVDVKRSNYVVGWLNKLM